MAVTRINNNQITDASAGNVYLGINANTKLQNYSITSNKIANNLTYGSDLTVSGNLTVNGSSTAIDTTITTIEDPVIVLASTQTGAPAVDIGFIGERGTSENIAFVWDESAQEFVTVFTSTSETNTTITITGYANAHVGNMVVGGTTSLSGNVIGAANFTGNVTGGNLLTPGLISVAGNVTAANFIGNISGNISAAGANTQVLFNDGGIANATSGFTFDKTSNLVTVAGNVTSGNVLTAGLISATGNITGGNANIIGTTASTSKTTGALKVAGGVGVVGDIYAGNSVVVEGGAYGNVTTTQFASVFASSANANPYSVMQVRSSDNVSGIGMQAFTGTGALYANAAINFVTGATLRDRDVYTGGATRATLNSTGLAVFIEILIMFFTGLGYMVNTKFSNALVPKVAPSTTDSL